MPEIIKCKYCKTELDDEEVEAFNSTGEQLCDNCFLNHGKEEAIEFYRGGDG